MAYASMLIIVLLAMLGFAAFSPDAATQAMSPTGGDIPAVKARIAAAILADIVSVKEPVDSRSAARLQSAAIEPLPQSAGEASDTLSTTSSPGPSTTTTTAEAVVAAPAPTTTTTTQPPAPTTTTPPAPTTTTTTVPPTTTTTTPPTTTTTIPDWYDDGGPRDPAYWRDAVASYFPAELVDDALWVIGCESHGDPLAVNPSSGASGLFQFMPTTWSWASVGAGWDGHSVFEPEANIAAAAWLVQATIDDGHPAGPWAQWSCRP